MCGHVGLFGTGITKNHIAAFKDMLYVDALRGEHATGLGDVSIEGDMSYFKVSCPVWEFLKRKDVDDYMRDFHKKTVIMGHNRYATQGKLVSENAHPFNHGHILMAHNGTLDSRYGLSGAEKDFEVDSNHIAYSLSQGEAKPILEKLDGAYALVWYDAKTETLNFSRNWQRPMYIAKVDKSDVYMYASEKWMLYAGATRKRRNIKFSSVEELPLNVIRSFKIPTAFKDNVVQEEDVKYTRAYASSFNSGQYYGSGASYKSSRYKNNRNGGGTGRTLSPMANDYLKSQGLAYNAQVPFTPVEWVPAIKSKEKDPHAYGSLIGYLDNGNFNDVVISNVKKCVFDYLAKFSWERGRVMTVGITGTGNTQRYSSGDSVQRDTKHPYICGSAHSIFLSSASGTGRKSVNNQNINTLIAEEESNLAEDDKSLVIDHDKLGDLGNTTTSEVTEEAKKM